nr:MAG TPA: hypothetical protein [Bacteriophage sp.]
MLRSRSSIGVFWSPSLLNSFCKDSILLFTLFNS